MSEKPRILIVGTGAMACLFGAKLAPFVRVTLLGTWREGVAALRTGGIRIDESGQTSNVPVEVIDSPEMANETSLALVVVKSWQTIRAGQQLQECLAEDGIVLTLQNGLGNREVLAGLLGEGRVAQGVTTHGATMLGPGQVRVGGYGKISLAADPDLAEFESLFNQAGLNAERVEDIQGLIWSKLVVNAGINPLTALLRVLNGDLLKHASARRLMEAAAEEAAEVATRMGVKLSFDDPGRYVAEVASRTAANRSSMLQDILRGAPTEIDAINGALVEVAERIGWQAPVNQTLTDLVRVVRDVGGEPSRGHRKESR